MLGLALYAITAVGMIVVVLMLMTVPDASADGAGVTATPTTIDSGHETVDGWECGDCGTVNEDAYDVCRECVSKR